MKLVTFASLSEVERTLKLSILIFYPANSDRATIWSLRIQELFLIRTNRKLQSDWIDHPAKTWHVAETTGTRSVRFLPTNVASRHPSGNSNSEHAGYLLSS